LNKKQIVHMKTKIALITGGSRGLGREMALSLAGKGNDVIITYHTNQVSAEEIVQQIKATGQKAAALPFHAEDLQAQPKFIKQLTDTLNTWNTNRFDFLINNAGIGATLPIPQVTEEKFDELMNIHYKSVYFLTQRCIPLLADGGAVIFISSGTTRFCVPGYSVYASLKGAVEVLAKYAAKELGSRGIRANVVAPGPVETDFNNAAIRSNPQLKTTLAAQSALGRVGNADDIGGVVAFLCSEEARWINAQRIEVSGGIFL
jgi:NAD(P)-dependent dehydrogenase (short-subunit alcohol dehydrogenase family)